MLDKNKQTSLRQALMIISVALPFFPSFFFFFFCYFCDEFFCLLFFMTVKLGQLFDQISDFKSIYIKTKIKLIIFIKRLSLVYQNPYFINTVMLYYIIREANKSFYSAIFPFH